MSAVFDKDMVDQVVRDLRITDLSRATIGQVVLVAQTLKKNTGIPFIRMDQGSPGLPPCEIGIRAEKEALDTIIASQYPAAEGISTLKYEASRFIKAFLDVEVSAESCIPTVGSVMGSFSAFIACNQLDEKKKKVLFIDPGFPIQKSQLNVIGYGYEAFDIYNYRGEALRAKIESYLERGDISSIVYSNPNNPAWICLTEQELQIIGELATKHDIIVLEDLAYFGMDFRRELGKPFAPPYVPTVARYTDNYILMLSGSKIFSYAGQRIAISAVSNKLFHRCYPEFQKRYGGVGHFGSTFTNAIMYMITSGATHSVQFGLAAMMRAASDGEFDFVESTREYARRSERMKKLFLDNGFHIVYDNDLETPISEGFFFTIGYKNMNSAELMRELIYYGFSAITLTTTGSEQAGIRACTSRMLEELYPVMEERLKAFNHDH